MSEDAREDLSISQRVLEDTGYELVNAEKVNRVVNGTLNAEGIGNNADSKEILAHYDKLGGLIRRNGDQVRTGSFWDFKASKPRSKPQVEFVYRVNGREIFVPDGKELPGEVKAAKLLDEGDKKVAGAVEGKPKAARKRASKPKAKAK